MIKYIGSKRTLVPRIVQTIKSFPDVSSVCDLFSGTSRVGHALKEQGFAVTANDHNTYATCLARCYVQADRADVIRDAERLIAEFNALSGSAGYFTETFCEKSRFFMPKNGARIDAIRERIETLSLTDELKAVLLVSLIEAADRVDSTTGLQMAYLKQWAPRASNDLVLRMPTVLERAKAGKGSALQLDAIEAASAVKVDLTYLDPPYNQHSYLANYHIWESLVLWDKPEVYGIACKRVDVRERKSAFNSKKTAKEIFAATLRAVRSQYLVVSFSNEGFHTGEELIGLLRDIGELSVLEVDFKRYVGAQIGIHNLKGERVGQVSHLRNKEYLFVVGRNGLPQQVRKSFVEQPSFFG